MQLSPSFLALAVGLGAVGLVDAAPARFTRRNDPALYGLINASDDSTIVAAGLHSKGKHHAADVDAKLCLDALLGYVDCKTGAKPTGTSSKGQGSSNKPKKSTSVKKPANRKPADKKPSSKKPSGKKSSSKKPPPPPPASSPVAQPKQVSSTSSTPKPSEHNVAAAVASPSKLNDASAHGGNGGIASGGSAACSTGTSLLGLNALNFNSCNGGNGGSAPGGSATGGRIGPINLLPRDKSQSLIGGVLQTIGLRRRASVPSDTDPDTDTRPVGMPTSDAQADPNDNAADVKRPQVDEDGDEVHDDRIDYIQARQVDEPYAEGSLDGESTQGDMEARQVDDDGDDVDYTPSVGTIHSSDDDDDEDADFEPRLVLEYDDAFARPTNSKSVASMIRRALYDFLVPAAI